MTQHEDAFRFLNRYQHLPIVLTNSAIIDECERLINKIEDEEVRRAAVQELLRRWKL